MKLQYDSMPVAAAKQSIRESTSLIVAHSAVPASEIEASVSTDAMINAMKMCRMYT